MNLKVILSFADEVGLPSHTSVSGFEVGENPLAGATIEAQRKLNDHPNEVPTELICADGTKPWLDPNLSVLEVYFQMNKIDLIIGDWVDEWSFSDNRPNEESPKDVNPNFDLVDGNNLVKDGVLTLNFIDYTSYELDEPRQLIEKLADYLVKKLNKEAEQR